MKKSLRRLLIPMIFLAVVIILCVAYPLYAIFIIIIALMIAWLIYGFFTYWEENKKTDTVANDPKQRAQADKQRKAEEKPAQKVEKPAIIVTPSGAFPVSDYFKRLEEAPQQPQIEEKETDQALHESAELRTSETVYSAMEAEKHPDAKATTQKEPVQPAHAVSPASASNQPAASADETEPEAVRILRDKICRELRDNSYHFDATGPYRLELLQGEEQRYFGNWPYASIELNLKTGKLWVDLFTYPNAFGYAREEHCAISAERFHEIAVECGLSQELQWFRTEEDWARLFDDHLQSVIDDNVTSKRKKDAKEKEEMRLSHGVELSSEYWTQAPGMWIESIRMLLKQQYGKSGVSLTKKNGTYYLQGQALSSAEAVWVERQVEAALESHDGSTWSSFVGGDRMSVTIRTSRWANVEMKYGTVPTKYYNLLSQLERLHDYGSKDMRSQHGDK
jgi:hypothetical protein